jgi:hypothetical protein
MRKFVYGLIFMTVMPVLAYAELDAVKFKKEAPAFEKAINAIADSVLPEYGVREPARSSYLEGYGPVFFIEIALERASNPFFSPGTPAEVKKNMERRLKEVKDKLSDLMKQRFSELTAAGGDAGALSVVVYVFNSNPGYAPDIPSQVVFTARKQAAGVDVAIHEYRLDSSRR